MSLLCIRVYECFTLSFCDLFINVAMGACSRCTTSICMHSHKHAPKSYIVSPQCVAHRKREWRKKNHIHKKLMRKICIFLLLDCSCETHLYMNNKQICAHTHTHSMEAIKKARSKNHFSWVDFNACQKKIATNVTNCQAVAAVVVVVGILRWRKLSCHAIVSFSNVRFCFP